MIPDDKTLHRFIRDYYPGGYGRNPLAAIHHIARLYGIAIAYLDRRSFEHHIQERRGIPLTEGEWARISDFEDAYDQFVETTHAPYGNTVDSEFMNHWLDKHEIPGFGGEKWVHS